MKKALKNLIGFPGKFWNYLVSVFKEIRVVEFPARPYTFNMTHIVLISSVALGLALFGIDTLFNYVRILLTTFSK